MIIKKSLPHVGYAKISNSIFTNTVLSHGAVRLYGYLASLPNGKTFIDKDIMKAIGVSQPMLTRWKRELKDQDLILLVMLAPRIYDLYIGHPELSAGSVKRRWEENYET
jgi:hypothetical protein